MKLRDQSSKLINVLKKKKKEKKLTEQGPNSWSRGNRQQLGDLLSCAYTGTVFTNSPQQTPQLDRHVSKLWGGWVYPIWKGTMVSSPKYGCLASWRSQCHEMETASASYWPHTHVWPRSTRRVYRDAWPLASHYRAVSCFHLFSSLTFRIIGFKKREEGMKRKHFYCLSMSNCHLALLRYWRHTLWVQWHSAYWDLLLLAFSEDGMCTFLCDLTEMWAVYSLQRSHTGVMSEAILECPRLYSYVRWKISHALKE